MGKCLPRSLVRMEFESAISFALCFRVQRHPRTLYGNSVMARGKIISIRMPNRFSKRHTMGKCLPRSLVRMKFESAISFALCFRVQRHPRTLYGNSVMARGQIIRLGERRGG